MKRDVIEGVLVYLLTLILVALLQGVPAFGKTLDVNASAYTSHVNQNDSDPWTAAWNNKLDVSMKRKVIAVSRDLLTRHGLRNHDKALLICHGIMETVEVIDKMNKRYSLTVDIYYGLDLKGALSWGRRKCKLTL